MKTIFYFLLFISCAGFAQTKRTKSADKHYEGSKYNLAIKAYEKLLAESEDDQDYIFSKLGDCYYHLFNYERAILYYEKVIDRKSDININFRYAEMLKAAGRFDEAKQQMQIFSKAKPNDLRAKNFLKNPAFLEEINDKVSLYQLDSLAINSLDSDFGGVLFQDKFYFLSNRERLNAQQSAADNTGALFTNVYVGDFKNKRIDNVQEIRELNSRWLDEQITFAKDGSHLYMASENYNLALYDRKKYDVSSVDKSGVFAIFKVSKDNSRYWRKFEPLSFIDSKFSYRDPYLTDDGKILYFSSDMPGGFGGMDIWSVAILSDGMMGEPKNMGDKINSSLDERFPFYNEADGFLYFSSQGHESLGGLDVFRYHLNNKQNQPQNLGLPVNSPQNDYAFVLYPKQDIGFVSSNKTGNDNIYQLRNMDLVSYQFEVALINEQLPLANVAVVVVDAQNNEFLNTQTDSEGIVHFNLPQNKKFTIKFIEKDCKIEYINVQTGNEIDQVKKREVFMSPIKIKDDIEQMELALYFEFNQFNITAEAAMEIERVKDILNKNPTYRLKITTHTDSRGSESYNQKLSEKRALSIREFMISKGIDPSRLQAEGKGSSQPKINCEDCTEEQHKMNRRSQFEFYID